MDSEENTFNILKRTPFAVVKREIDDSRMTYLRFDDFMNNAEKILSRHGWTLDEFAKINGNSNNVDLI